jgi:RNA polymerase sigma factor FliA
MDTDAPGDNAHPRPQRCQSAAASSSKKNRPLKKKSRGPKSRSRPPSQEAIVVLARAYRPLHDVRRIDGMTREEICRHYQARILKLARRAFDQIGPEGSPLSPDDLVSHGVLGLLEAFERYERSFGVDFASFAEYRIRGAMLDARRSADPSTRRRRELAQQLQDATRRLQLQGLQKPSHEELAAELGLEVEAYWQLLDQLAPVTLVPLELAFSVPEEPSAPRMMLGEEARDILRTALDELPERERLAVLLYYGRDCSLAEIAVLFEVTPSRVSQLLSIARGRLRAALSEAIDLPSLFDESAR